MFPGDAQYVWIYASFALPLGIDTCLPLRGKIAHPMPCVKPFFGEDGN